MHCFTGGPDEARRCLDIGAFLSFSGIVTFKGAEDVRDAAALCPLDRLLVETDAPFLAPVPHRGKQNRPAWVRRRWAKRCRRSRVWRPTSLAAILHGRHASGVRPRLSTFVICRTVADGDHSGNVRRVRDSCVVSVVIVTKLCSCVVAESAARQLTGVLHT